MNKEASILRKELRKFDKKVHEAIIIALNNYEGGFPIKIDKVYRNKNTFDETTYNTHLKEIRLKENNFYYFINTKLLKHENGVPANGFNFDSEYPITQLTGPNNVEILKTILSL